MCRAVSKGCSKEGVHGSFIFLTSTYFVFKRGKQRAVIHWKADVTEDLCCREGLVLRLLCFPSNKCSETDSLWVIGSHDRHSRSSSSDLENNLIHSHIQPFITQNVSNESSSLHGMGSFCTTAKINIKTNIKTLQTALKHMFEMVIERPCLT